MGIEPTRLQEASKARLLHLSYLLAILCSYCGVCTSFGLSPPTVDDVRRYSKWNSKSRWFSHQRNGGLLSNPALPFSFSPSMQCFLPIRKSMILFGSSSSSSSSSSNTFSEQSSTTTMSKEQRDEASLMRAMDMNTILELVARHAGTWQGRNAILAASGCTDASVPSQGRNQLVALGRDRLRDEKSQSARQRWARAEAADYGSFARSPSYKLKEADTAGQSRHQYDLVAQAKLILEQPTASSVENTYIGNLTIPPIYAADSGPFDTQFFVDTDDDEWLGTPVSEWEFEDILKADQVVQKLLNVHDWAASSTDIQTWTPLLQEIAMCINASSLEALHAEIHGAVEVRRAQTIADPSGRSSFIFRLNSTRFPVLQILRKKEEDLADQCRKRGAGREKELSNIRDEIMGRESAIKFGLISAIAKLRQVIDDGLCTVAELDTIMARAAYGISSSGSIPTVQSEGVVDVQGFLHPLLPRESAVPVDLNLSPKSREQALIISGVNGGGKTLAMKSFCVVALLAKLGIPIPTSDKGSIPRVDYFARLHAYVGDQQNILEGQSTFMAQMTSFSELIGSVEANASVSRLVLLDELGGGTDQNAGGAIAQAILEKLLESPQTRVVATTHNPRLKALSFDSPVFGCAAVQLQSLSSGKTQVPSFQLKYGIIADSSALNAASRCFPPFPEDVMNRATQLMGSTDDNLLYRQSLGKSLDKQLKLAEQATIDAEAFLSTAAECQAATRRVAIAYERHFGLLEQRLQKCYNEMKDAPDSFTIIGDSLAEVRAVKKQVRSESDFLKEKGLRLLPDDYVLEPNESVTIVAEGEWHGEMASVYVPPKPTASSSSLGTKVGRNDVIVIPSLMPWIGTGSDSEMNAGNMLVFKRYELAIWDYSALDEYEEDATRITSVSDSKRKLSRVLSQLSSSGDRSNTARRATGDSSSVNKFKSSRDRKANKKKNKKRR